MCPGSSVAVSQMISLITIGSSFNLRIAYDVKVGLCRLTEGTRIKQKKNKGLIVCWNKQNKSVWYAASDCLSERGLSHRTNSILSYFAMGTMKL